MIYKGANYLVYEIEIYEDKEGNSELKDWFRELKYRKDRGIKDARIILNQIHYCIEILLNHFRKETQKTPTREIKKALKLRDDWNKQYL